MGLLERQLTNEHRDALKEEPVPVPLSSLQASSGLPLNWTQYSHCHKLVSKYLSHATTFHYVKDVSSYSSLCSLCVLLWTEDISTF